MVNTRYAMCPAPKTFVALCLFAAAHGIVVSARPATAAGDPTPLQPVAPPERLGPVWPIQEQDMRRLIESRLREHLPDLQAQLAGRLAAYRAPAISLPTRQESAHLDIDPSITLAGDLTDHTGAVLAKSGQRVNPLDFVPFTRTYLVINGADPRQLLWAKDHLTAAPTTILLTDGSLPQIRHAVPARVAVFPAPAALFARLPIDTVPARIAKAGHQIAVDLIAERTIDAYATSSSSSHRTGQYADPTIPTPTPQPSTTTGP